MRNERTDKRAVARTIRAPGMVATLVLIGADAWGTYANAQILETETARLPSSGAWEVSGNFEHQTSGGGRENALPWAIEHGFANGWELLIEPVPYTRIEPTGAARATGPGDVEITMTHLFRPEGRMPALAWAAEVKVPTARDPLIGTRQYDYAGYFIASKRFGRFDVHANVSYALFGTSAETARENALGFAIGTVFRPRPKYEVFAEVVSSQAPGGSEQTTDPATPEAAGEAATTIGAALFFRSDVLGFVSVGNDNNGARLARVGFTVSFGVSRRGEQ